MSQHSEGRRSRGPRTRSVVAATAVLVVGIVPLADAATGSNIREGLRNGTATQETQIISRVDAASGTTGGYSTRQSNLSASGGGAVYGCRSTAGTSTGTTPKNPCLRVNNLADGNAFEFNATRGESAGLITVGTGGDTKRPFTTNATGVATGLNADRVDGKSADEIAAGAVATARAKAGLDADTVDGLSSESLKTRWALIDETGAIIGQSGGFAVLDGYTTNNNIYIDAGSSLEGKGLTATLAIQNTTDTNGDGAATTNEFGGEISVGRCQVFGVNCAPANSKNANAFVVSPRNSDGTATAGSATNPRKRFFVSITE